MHVSSFMVTYRAYSRLNKYKVKNKLQMTLQIQKSIVGRNIFCLEIYFSIKGKGFNAAHCIVDPTLKLKVLSSLLVWFVIKHCT